MKIDGVENIVLGLASGKRIEVQSIKKGKLRGLNIAVVKNNCLWRLFRKIFGCVSGGKALELIVKNSKQCALDDAAKKKLQAAVEKRISVLKKRKDNRTLVGKCNKLFGRVGKIEKAIKRLSLLQSSFKIEERLYSQPRENQRVKETEKAVRKKQVKETPKKKAKVTLTPRADISTEDLLAQIENTPSLGKLDLSTCSDQVTDKVLKAVGKLQGLEELVLVGSTSFTSEGLKQIGGCSQLEDLKVVNCTYVTGEVLESIGKLRELGFLDLEGCSSTTGPVAEGWKKIFTTCTNLEYLNLPNYVGLTDESLVKLGSLEKLNIFDIKNCESLTLKGLGYIEECTALENLCLENCLQDEVEDDVDQSNALVGIFNACPNLEEVNIKDLWIEGKEAFTALAKLKKLEILRFDCSLSSEKWNELAASSSLTELDLSAASFAFERLSRLKPFKEVTKLLLGNCTLDSDQEEDSLVDNRFFEGVATTFPKLKSVDITETACTEDVSEHLKKCKQLEKIIVTGCDLEKEKLQNALPKVELEGVPEQAVEF